VFATLREVVDFFDRGGGEVANKSPKLRPLGLTEGEKNDLVAFLEALSMDRPLIVETPKLPPLLPLDACANPGCARSLALRPTSNPSRKGLP
jgi:cytochrome c peroxidase